MVLYHAVSTFHILECIVHHLRYTPDKDAVLVLPDFIVFKYPQYKRLERLKLFKKVRLLSYMHIPHDEQTVYRDTEKYYKREVKYRIDKFEEIYCAGAHFYFSLYLIKNKIHFTAFEDAAGMLSRDGEMYRALSRNYPVHADIAKKNGLFSLDNRYIDRVICHKASQTINVDDDRFVDFNPVTELAKLDEMQRKKVISFFIDKTYTVPENSVLVLTQHFANLGNMSMEKQEKVYDRLLLEMLKDKSIIVKPHPDDTLDYEKRYDNITVIHEKFPSELLPFVFIGKPEKVITINSTGAALLSGSFEVEILNDYAKEIKHDSEVFF